MDAFKKMLGEEVFHGFTTTTKEHSDATADAKEQLKAASFDKMLVCMCFRQVDQDECGSLMRGFKTQFSLENNQFPEKPLETNEVMNSHRWDEQHHKKKKEQKKNNGSNNGTSWNNNNNDDNSSDSNKKSEEQEGTNLNQTNAKCCCCGEKGIFQVII